MFATWVESVGSHVVNFGAHKSLLYNHLACCALTITITTMKFSALFLPFIVILLGLSQVVALIQPANTTGKDSESDLRQGRDFAEGEHY